MTTFNKALVLVAILTAMAASTAFADGTTGRDTAPLHGSENGIVCPYQNNGDNTCYGPQQYNGGNGQSRGFCGGRR